jgi:fission process protein 1
MLFPALTIHSAVKYSAKYGWSKSTKPRFKAWGPTLTGLAIVPALPYLFDECALSF